MITHSRQKESNKLKIYRKLHRKTGALLFAVFFVIGLTGFILAWKKHSGNLLMHKTMTGISKDSQDWLSLDSIKILATNEIKRIKPNEVSTIDRLDIRTQKGVAKVLFEEHYTSFQIDLTSGKILTLENRSADFIENLHDGSLFDKYLGIDDGWIKLIYSSISGLALILFTFTGFWLWYGPKRLKKQMDKKRRVKK